MSRAVERLTPSLREGRGRDRLSRRLRKYKQPRSGGGRASHSASRAQSRDLRPDLWGSKGGVPEEPQGAWPRGAVASGGPTPAGTPEGDAETDLTEGVKARPPAGCRKREGPRGQSRSWPECCPRGPRRARRGPALLSGAGPRLGQPGALAGSPRGGARRPGVGLALPLSGWRTRLGARLRPTSLGGGASPRPRARRWAPSQRRESRGRGVLPGG